MAMMDYGKRYDSKREAGISQYRSDGSSTSRDTDIEAGAAEQFAAEFFDVVPNMEIYADHGDGGCDFRLGEATVDAVHLGMVGGKPRRDGNLLVNPHEPQRWADIYVVVRGSTSEGFEMVGWLDHEKLITRPKKDFGYGLRFNWPVRELHPISDIVEALAEAS